jgi:ankyrin repeat protein
LNSKSDPDGYTPLIEAAKAGHAEVVKRLLAAGADPKIKDRVGRTAPEWGADYPEVVALLGGSARPTATTKAVKVVSSEQKENARQKLEELGITDLSQSIFVYRLRDRRQCEGSGRSHHHSAAGGGARSGCSRPPARHGGSECERERYQRRDGADVNARAAGGGTPNMMAEVMKCTETLKLLKAAGAKK